MGKKTYTGFNDAQEKQIRAVVADASVALSKAYAGHVNNNDGPLFTTWFGTGARATVKDILHRMNYAMTNGSITINYSALGNCAGGTTNAVAYSPAHGWGQASIAQAASAASNFTLDICPRLLKAMSFTGSGSQSQVGTLLHEISHLLGNTDDEVDPGNNTVAYGSVAAKRLARLYPNQAVNNAENFGFYISAYL